VNEPTNEFPVICYVIHVRIISICFVKLRIKLINYFAIIRFNIPVRKCLYDNWEECETDIVESNKPVIVNCLCGETIIESVKEVYKAKNIAFIEEAQYHIIHPYVVLPSMYKKQVS